MSRVSRDSLDVYLFSLVFPRFPMLTQYLSLCPGPILIYHPPIMPNAHLASPRIPYAHLCPPGTVVLLRAPKNMLAGMLLLFCNSNFPAKSHFKASKRLTKRQSSS